MRDNLYNKTKNVQNFFCEIIQKALKSLDYEKYILAYLSTFTKQEPPDYDSILSVIKQRREEEQQGEFKFKKLKKKLIPPHLNPQTGKKFQKSKALLSSVEITKFICWLVNANQLYNIALQTYDLDIVTLIARQTQKDPKEYLPYIENLKSIKDEVERRYTINIDLRNFKSAILELSKGNTK